MAFHAAEYSRGELTRANQPSVECDPGSRCTDVSKLGMAFEMRVGERERTDSVQIQ